MTMIKQEFSDTIDASISAMEKQIELLNFEKEFISNTTTMYNRYSEADTRQYITDSYRLIAIESELIGKTDSLNKLREKRLTDKNKIDQEYEKILPQIDSILSHADNLLIAHQKKGHTHAINQIQYLLSELEQFIKEENKQAICFFATGLKELK